MAKHYYYIEDELFAEFRKRYPELWEYGTTYYGRGFDTIRIRMPTKGCVEFNRFSNTLVWLDRNGDKDYEAKQRADRKANMHRNFIQLLHDYQKLHNASQGMIAKQTGISRRKINEYLNGKAIPKISTMKKILEALDIDMTELEKEYL